MLKMKGLKAFVVGTVVAATVFTASLPIAAASTGKVTADVLNLRSGKSLASAVIAKIPQNATVSILDNSDSTWAKVSYNNKTGYVSKEFLSSGTSANLGTGTVTADVLNVRKTASTNAAIVGKLSNNQTVTIQSKSNGWYQVKAGNISGYVVSDYISQKTTTGKVSADILNVRSGASTTSSKVGSLKQGDTVTILSTSGDWYNIKSGSITGFVFKQYINTGNTGNTAPSNSTATPSSNLVKGNIFKCTVASLNVRKTPSTSAARVATLTKGNQVTFVSVASQDKNWYQIKTSKGITGYVHKDYVEFFKKGTSSATSASTSGAGSISRDDNVGSSSPSGNSSKADKVVSTAKKYLGTRYVYGGSSPSGFDCSGFTQYVLKQNGVSVSRTSKAQAGNGTAVSKSNLKTGDLVFFSSSRGQSAIGHVGIYIGGGQFIHASSGKQYKVIISSLSEPFYVSTYRSARRVL